MDTEEILKLKERIELATEIGESYYREFKSALEGPPDNKTPRDVKEICYDVAKTLVAFANADGGELFVGIEDDNQILGIPHNQNAVQLILDSAKNNILKETPVPVKRATIVEINSKKVAYFSVDKGTKYIHQTSKGECFQRKDRESEPTSADLIRLERDEEISREYDRHFIDAAKVSDLDISLINEVSQNIFKTISPEKFLQYLELAEFDGDRLKLRKAATLLFAKDAQKWHPRIQVRILKIKGTEEKVGSEFNVQEVGEASGNVFQLVDRSWELLRPHLTETRFSKDALFRTQILYPETACREALINAITHRDYSAEGRGIEVKIYDDRLTISNPGELLSSITIKDLEELKGSHQSRNTYIARVLREFGYIRELGEGIRRIFELMSQNDLVKPSLESANKTFAITLFYKHVYTKEEKLWLEQFEPLNLSREEKTVVRLGLNSRLVSTREIFDQVGIVSEDAFRQLIESLRGKRILKNKLTSSRVTNLKRKYGNSRKAVPRYEITMPEEGSETEKFEVDSSDYAKIYITNIHYDTTEDDMEKAFQSFGEIEDISLPKNPFNGRGRGFGFLEFTKKGSALKALKHTHNIIVKGRKLFVQEFKK
ncbi:putative DNA binding domain-containing protein [Reichenbachiella agarivorans]|uniref:DNA binding domain-containing protein n=1 Tax=Reichenbachiella agarivorans TaxID=2979464 RepID=A0ABY6CT49_9BACT|nr:ATP-binding protein [Reichenbachiella agarivorans]UXP33029.1 putative DNA binding domain-containing protein [Reichenbachiella agarivorans]